MAIKRKGKDSENKYYKDGKEVGEEEFMKDAGPGVKEILDKVESKIKSNKKIGKKKIVRKGFGGKQNTNKNGTAGRPTKKVDDSVQKLIEAIKYDFTVEEACSYAKISTSAYYEWLKNDKEFAEKIADAEKFLFIEAKKKIARGILMYGNTNDAKWLLERRQKEVYNTRQELTGKDGKDLGPAKIIIGLPKLPEEGMKD